MTNQERAERCRKRIRGYSGMGEPELTCLQDLITDALHAYGVEAVRTAVTMGSVHYHSEKGGTK